MNILATPTSSNRKTGNVPTLWIGLTREEGRESCAGCPLLDRGCYAHSGPSAMGADSARRGARKEPARYQIETALRGAARSARMLRATGIGDIGRSGRGLADRVVAAATSAGLALVGYTHHWRENGVASAWRGRLMASTETLEDADLAVDAGWRATVVVAVDAPRTATTPKGRKVIVCPAQVREGAVTCNECRLCDASKPGPIIAFRAHGNQARAAEAAGQPR